MDLSQPTDEESSFAPSFPPPPVQQSVNSELASLLSYSPLATELDEADDSEMEDPGKILFHK